MRPGSVFSAQSKDLSIVEQSKPFCIMNLAINDDALFQQAQEVLKANDRQVIDKLLPVENLITALYRLANNEDLSPSIAKAMIRLIDLIIEHYVCKPALNNLEGYYSNFNNLLTKSLEKINEQFNFLEPKDQELITAIKKDLQTYHEPLLKQHPGTSGINHAIFGHRISKCS
jgi:hypothetical protein